MEYVNLEIDFIDRTLKILKQYEDRLAEKEHNERFEITLLINCLLGLLIVPKEKGFFDNFLPRVCGHLAHPIQCGQQVCHR